MVIRSIYWNCFIVYRLPESLMILDSFLMHGAIDGVSFCGCRKLKIVQKTDNVLIGISAPGIKASRDGTTDTDPSSYCMMSSGAVMAGGRWTLYSNHLPASSIIQPELYKQRRGDDAAFAAGDEVVVTLDCSAHTMRLQSPTVDHSISILQQHRSPQQQWVLNLNFWIGGLSGSFADEVHLLP